MKQLAASTHTILFLTLLLPLACPQTVCESPSSCSICYSQTGTESGILMDCQYTYCEQQMSYTEYNPSTNSTQTHTECVRYGVKHLDESSCLRTCCGAVTAADYFSVGELNKCVEFYRSLWAVILGSILYFIALIILTIGACVSDPHSIGSRMEDIFGCCFECLRRRRPLPQPEVYESSIKSSEGDWIAEINNQNKLLMRNQSIPCEVCHEPSINTMSSQMKFYHLQCLANKIKKSNDAQHARNTSISYQYYCRECCERYYRMSYAEMRTMERATIIQLGERCDHCMR